MDNEGENSIDARAPKNPVTKRNPRGAGQKPNSFYQVPVQEVINMTAPHAARILQSHIKGERRYKNLKKSLQDVCFYVIDHAIGKSRQKVEHSGGIMTYGELAKSAEKLEKKPRPILADVEEIAQKYQEKIAQSGDNQS